jgi:hypothetical protein
MLQKVFFQFQGLAAVSAVLLVLGAHAPRGMLLASRNVYGGMGAALGILLMVGIFLMAFAIMTSVTYFTSLQLHGFSFSPLADPAAPGLIGWRRLYGALYATVNIAGGASEGSPVTVLAMFIGMLGTITYLLLTVIVLASLAGIAITAPSDPE